jgi:hypothetical protein
MYSRWRKRLPAVFERAQRHCDNLAPYLDFDDSHDLALEYLVLLRKYIKDLARSRGVTIKEIH